MKLDIESFAPAMLTGDGAPMGEGRAPGLHLGEVIRYMRFAAGDLKGDLSNDNFAKIGFMLESMIEQALARYITFSEGDLVCPGEMEVDTGEGFSVWMNPERVQVDEEVLWEFKVTWKTIKNLREVFLEKFWYYVVQTANYARALGLRKVRIVILFLMGDYTFKPPMGGPQLVIVNLEFSDAELDGHWRVMLQHAKDYRRQEATRKQREASVFDRINRRTD